MCPEIQEVTGSKHSEEIILEALNRSLEREQWYRQQIKELSGELSNARRLLEYQRPTPFWKKWFK
jgi:hypothetical protein